jgi:hypothetical protein
MMDNDDVTFKDKKNKTNKKQHKNEYVEKKKKDKKKMLSLEEEYYGPLLKAEEKEKYVLIQMYSVDKLTVSMELRFSIKIAHFGPFH